MPELGAGGRWGRQEGGRGGEEHRPVSAPMRAGFILCEIRRMRAGEGRGSGYLLERTLQLLCG